jgi:hypothetical protein
VFAAILGENKWYSGTPPPQQVIAGHKSIVNHSYLVGGFNNLEKYEFVNGKDYSQYIMAYYGK